MGTQKELAELIIELQNKGWVKNDKSIAEIARQFSAVFNLSGTKKENNSDETNSLNQILKPQQSKELNYQNTFPQVYSKRYKPKFEGIKKRK